MKNKEQIELINKHEDIIKLSRELNKLHEQKEKMLVEFNELKKDCNHSNKDGSSAVREAWDWDICDICGRSF